MTTITLNDGNKIPAVGFGVFLIPTDGPTYDAVRTALDAGYRHIDTAAAYFNEADVGRAVRDSGIPREEIFITSKLWLQDYGYEAAGKGLDTSLEKLGMDYVDLYLLHQPYGDVAGAWKALEDAKAAGKIKSIGVSNMTPKIWKEFVPQFKTLPAVNQVECNPFFQQRELRELLAKDDVKIEAYQPLGHGDSSLLTHPVITKLAEKYGKNAGQIILRFEIQAPPLAQVLKLVLGLVVVLAVLEGLKILFAALFGSHPAAEAVRYFLVVLVAGCIWPMTFGWFTDIAERLKRK